MATRLGVDVGGTFTDLVFYDDQTGEIRVGKEPTTPASPEQGVMNAVASAVPDGRLPLAGYFLHGTTVGLNALLTRTGAVVGLLATCGFRDILEIRRGDRDDVYDLFWTAAPPLVPRNLRIPVNERILAEGTVETALNLDDVRAAASQFDQHGVTAVAVAFVNAYANPAHELEAERILRDAGFDGEISLSHRVSGEYREYERTTTTVIDAYVRGRMANYLARLEDSLHDEGYQGEMLVTRSGGGAMTFAEAGTRPFETIMSGPVAGAEGAAELARALELGDVITADVGGTSFDTALITGGRPQLMYEGLVEDLPVQTPWVDVRSIGAGGGSIAYVDVGGLLRVGPQSAGAVPGPACYGRGGTVPTVTDAAFALGMLGTGELANGFRLDAGNAEAAIAPLAQQLRLDVHDVARGILTIAAASMANAIRSITIERGEDPRQITLMPFGGAGALFGTLIARELEMRQIVVPPVAGNFSAWGLLGADLTQTAARTRIMRLGPDSVTRIDELAQTLFEELRQREGASANALKRSREISVDMRYAGQEHTITTPLRVDDRGHVSASEDELAESFRDVYERTFGHTMNVPAEVVSVRVTVRAALPSRAQEPFRPHTNGAGGTLGWLSAYSFVAEDWREFQVVSRDGLRIGTELHGPAIVLEETTSTYLDEEFSMRVGDRGVLFVTDESR